VPRCDITVLAQPNGADRAAAAAPRYVRANGLPGVNVRRDSLAWPGQRDTRSFDFVSWWGELLSGLGQEQIALPRQAVIEHAKLRAPWRINAALIFRSWDWLWLCACSIGKSSSEHMTRLRASANAQRGNTTP
jgi:hypothetical protein